jgi:hypothetical protein
MVATRTHLFHLTGLWPPSLICPMHRKCTHARLQCLKQTKYLNLVIDTPSRPASAQKFKFFKRVSFVQQTVASRSSYSVVCPVSRVCIGSPSSTLGAAGRKVGRWVTQLAVIARFRRLRSSINDWTPYPWPVQVQYYDTGQPAKLRDAWCLLVGFCPFRTRCLLQSLPVLPGPRCSLPAMRWAHHTLPHRVLLSVRASPHKCAK